jgi:nicotinate-nucleotide pyrophosphorylase (carboxylating)
MDWKSSRIDALLEQALVEDKAASDATTNVTIDPALRASASILARQEMIVAGLGAVPRLLEIFARLDPTLKSSMACASMAARYWP